MKPSKMLQLRLRIFISTLFSMLIKVSYPYRPSSALKPHNYLEKPSFLVVNSHLTCLLQVRGGGDRHGGYDNNLDDFQYNYDSQDRSRSRDESQNRYEEDYYGERDGKDTYGDKYHEEDDDYREVRKSPKKSARSSFSYMPDVIRSGNKKIGLSLLGCGVVFTVLGMSLFFNKTLMRLGNLLFISGVPITIGPGRTMGYFLQPKKARATGCLLLGIFLVMIGWPIFGIMLEIFGILNLFGNLFPLLKVLLGQVPGLGGLFTDRSRSRKKKNREKRNNRDDDYYSHRDKTNDDDEYYRDKEQYRRDYNEQENERYNY